MLALDSEAKSVETLTTSLRSFIPCSASVARALRSARVNAMLMAARPRPRVPSISVYWPTLTTVTRTWPIWDDHRSTVITVPDGTDRAGTLVSTAFASSLRSVVIEPASERMLRPILRAVLTVLRVSFTVWLLPFRKAARMASANTGCIASASSAAFSAARSSAFKAARSRESLSSWISARIAAKRSI
jgi:hypothetical protein